MQPERVLDHTREVQARVGWVWVCVCYHWW
jgi:hypothetical protein